MANHVTEAEKRKIFELITQTSLPAKKNAEIVGIKNICCIRDVKRHARLNARDRALGKMARLIPDAVFSQQDEPTKSKIGRYRWRLNEHEKLLGVSLGCELTDEEREALTDEDRAFFDSLTAPEKEAVREPESGTQGELEICFPARSLPLAAFAIGKIEPSIAGLKNATSELCALKILMNLKEYLQNLLTSDGLSYVLEVLVNEKRKSA